MRVCIFVMLNPSTADANLDDPTIRRCISFAMREGCGALWVINLFSFRATEPKDMKNAADPHGPRNDQVLDEVLGYAKRYGHLVIVGWGAHGTYKSADLHVAALANKHQITLHCFGTTGVGQPRHPLYVKGDTPLMEWKPTPH